MTTTLNRALDPETVTEALDQAADLRQRPTGAAAAASPTPPRRRLGLGVILAATLLDLLDSTIMNVAAPTIHRSLGGSTEALQWIAAAYTLAFAAGLLLGGRLGDKVGRRPMLLGACLGFVLASVACAAAWSPGSLIAFRGAQGLLAALMVPQCFGLLRDLFPGPALAKAFAVFGPAIGLATILGPVVAGVLINADLFGSGWRAVFLINVPLGAFVLGTGRRALPAPDTGQRGQRKALRVDPWSALIAGIAMTMVVYPLIQGRESGWPLWSLLLPVAGVAVFAGFGLRQRRLMRSGRSPLVIPAVFRSRSYTSGLVFLLTFFGAIIGFSLSLGMFLQLGLGYTALHAAMVAAASAAGAFVGSALSGTAGVRLGRRILNLGLAVMALGIGWFLAVLAGAGGAVTGAALAGPLALYGLGMGAIFVPLFDLVLGEVRDEHVGSASGVLEAVQQLGACLGVAVLGTVFFDVLGSTPGPAALPAVRAAEHVAYIALGLTAAAFALVFLLPRKARQVH